MRLSQLKLGIVGSFLAGAAIMLQPAGTAVAQEQKLTALKFGFLKIAGYTNIYAAQKEGMFRRNGLEVTSVFFRSGSDAVSAAQGGSIDIFSSFPAAVISADERGFDFGAIFQNEITYEKGPDTGAILVLKDSGIKSVKDLVGKRVAVSARSSQATVAVDEVLRQHGIDPKQVIYLEAGYPNFFDMLRTRQVDAVTSTEPFTTQIIQSGIAEVIGWHYAEAFPGGPLSAVFAKRAFIEQNRATIDRFNTAMKESIDYMMSDMPRGKKLVVEFTGLDPAIVEKMVYSRYNYDVIPAKWQQLIQIMTNSQILDKPHTPDEFFSDPIKPYIHK